MDFPNLILLNGKVRTMDQARPVAEAVAVLDERILALGTNDQIRLLAGPQTRIIDARQGNVLPGFNDSHVHFLAGGFSLSNVNLREASSPEDLAQRLGQYIRTIPQDRWILGGDWDHESWAAQPGSQAGAPEAHRSGSALPNRWLIDKVAQNHPVLITRLDGHMALANSLALKLAGINKDTADPPGGLIVRDPKTGEPTGILKDAAQTLVERVIPPKSAAEKRAAALAATSHAAGRGVTSLTDVSTDDDLAVYDELLKQGGLKTRIYAARSIVAWERLAHAKSRNDPGAQMIRTGILKGFSDGSLGSSTALFFEPYADEPGNRGLLFDQMFPEGIMRARVEAADKRGLQVMIHAIGDEANLRILDLYDEVAKVNGPRDRRFRIEHAQHLRQTEIPRFARQQVIASMQPYHASDDGRWCEQRLGYERSKGAYAFRSLSDSGACLAFGSDWTVAPLNPLPGIQAAVTRRTLDGKHPNGWFPEQKISLDEAIRAYTLGSAYAEFAEEVKGTLAPGKLADLVVLDRDIYRCDADKIDQARVRLTILNGQVVHEVE